MVKKLLASALLTGALLAADPANATILLNLINEQVECQTPYALTFVADKPVTYISFAGYQVPSFIQATEIALALCDPNAGCTGINQFNSENLLAQTWTFIPGLVGSWADQDRSYGYDTGTNPLEFGDTVAGAYDVFTQAVTTLPGDTYVLNFLYTQDYAGPNGFHVEVDTTLPGPEGVPEPATWEMMVAGFGLAGLGMRVRRKRLGRA